MKKFVLLVFFTASSQMIHAQSMGINTLTPDPSAALDIQSDHQGLLVPRVSLKTLTDGETIILPSHSLLVYNRNGNLPGGTGYYYNAGTKQAPSWQNISSGGGNGIKKNAAFKAGSVSDVLQKLPRNKFTKVQFTNVVYDKGNDYDEAKSAFIAPVSGIFHFDAQVRFKYTSYSSFTNSLSFAVIRDKVVTRFASVQDMDFQKALSADLQLEAGDIVIAEVFVNLTSGPNGDVFEIDTATGNFNGRLVSE